MQSEADWLIGLFKMAGSMWRKLLSLHAGTAV